ncbi:MAG: ATP-binding protein [Phocaeicola sp.]
MQENTLFSKYQSNPILLDSLKTFHEGSNRDAVVNGILQNILQLYRASRTYMFLYDFDRNIQCHVCEVCANEVSDQQDIVSELPLSATPYFNKLVLNKKPWVVDRLSDWKDIAPSEYEILLEQDITSLIIVPLIFKESVLGYIGIDMVGEYKTWDSDDLSLLFSLSQIISTSVDMNYQLEQTKVKADEAVQGYDKIQSVLNHIYKDIPVGIELYDARGILIDINPIELKHFGIRDKRNILGISIFDNPILPDYVKQMLREGKNFEVMLDYDFKKIGNYFNTDLANSPEKCFNVIASVVRDANDTISCYQLFVMDITHMRKMQKELYEAKQKAEESNRLKSLFLANMSHEIRTPLNAIVGFSDLLHLSDAREEQEEFKNIIKENSELLLKIVNDILDLSKIEAGVLDTSTELFDLVGLMDEVSQIIRMSFNKPTIQFVINRSQNHYFIHADRQRITQVLVNFLSNAFKNTVSGRITMGYESTQTGVRVYVQDTGIGIPKEKHPLIFQRFEKLNSFVQGTGLGLTICKAISDALGGEIGLESEVGLGSLFWLSFPCQKEEVALQSFPLEFSCVND